MILKKIIRDCNEQFKEEWHFCKIKESDWISPFEIIEEATEKIEELPLLGVEVKI